MKRSKELQEVETVEEMIDYLKFYNKDITCATVRSYCEAAYSFGHEIDSDEVMIELGIGE